MSFQPIDNGYIVGRMIGAAVKGDSSVPVEKVLFGIPNMRQYVGASVRGPDDSQYTNRIILENDEYKVIVDKLMNYAELQKSLIDKGGFVVQYAGVITKKKGPILRSEIAEFLNCLNYFLSFINGRKTSVAFLHGLYNSETIWSDYGELEVDSYQSVGSWSDILLVQFNTMWSRFCELWKTARIKISYRPLYTGICKQTKTLG
jgi:hypothetical protein